MSAGIGNLFAEATLDEPLAVFGARGKGVINDLDL
jgi:hypothetical protein